MNGRTDGSIRAQLRASAVYASVYVCVCERVRVCMCVLSVCLFVCVRTIAFVRVYVLSICYRHHSL